MPPPLKNQKNTYRHPKGKFSQKEIAGGDLREERQGNFETPTAYPTFHHLCSKTIWENEKVANSTKQKEWKSDI